MKFNWIYDDVLCMCAARDVLSIGRNYYLILLLPLHWIWFSIGLLPRIFLLYFSITIPHVRSSRNRRDLPYLVLVTLQLLQRHNDRIKWSSRRTVVILTRAMTRILIVSIEARAIRATSKRSKYFWSDKISLPYYDIVRIIMRKFIIASQDGKSWRRHYFRLTIFCDCTGYEITFIHPAKIILYWLKKRDMYRRHKKKSTVMINSIVNRGNIFFLILKVFYFWVFFLRKRSRSF